MNSISVIRPLRQASQRAFTNCYHAPFRIPRRSVEAQRRLHVGNPAPPSLRRKQLPSGRIASQTRRESTTASQRPLTDRSDALEHPNETQQDDIAARKAQEPAYEITFTCRKCMDRSSHRVTKQAYHFGTTLITCPGCKNRHLISDHLKVFSDKNITLEDILKEKGQFLRKGRLGEDGDIEFYDETNNEIGLAQAEKAKHGA